MAASGGFGGHASGGHSFSGMRSGAGLGSHSYSGRSYSPRSYSRGNRASAFNRGFSGHRNRSGVGLRLRTRGYGYRCYEYGCGWGYGYPYLGYPYLGGGVDPYWWWDNDSSYDQQQQDEMGLANEMNAQSLDEQRMRQQSENDNDAYANSAPPRQPQHQSQPERTNPALATVLVFRDQRREEVQNYAIVGQTLWTFDAQHRQKIPLTDLDLPASTKANEERGVDFHVPVANEGQ
jgi:hypothetical protein